MNKLHSILHHLFIPKHTNNYRAKALHHDFLTMYLVFAVAVSFVFGPRGTNVLGYATDITVEKLLQLTNAERESKGLPTLSYNEKLEQAAQAKAKDMFQNNYWAHYSPDGSTTPWTFIHATGYQYEYAGENLAKNFMFSDTTVKAWMNSPTHRDNLLRKEYTEVGFAVVNGVLNGEETTLVVQMFGKPMPNQLSMLKETPNAPAMKVAPPVVNSEVLAKQSQGNPLFPAYFNANLIFFAFLILAFSLDLFIAARMKVLRVTGKNIVHIMFIIFVTIGLLIMRNGSII
jgi:uncharacterized protein YkwD